MNDNPKPEFPQGEVSLDHIMLYLSRMYEYERDQMKHHAIARIENTSKVTIYGGHRFVFCVQNRLGMRRYFDKCWQAVEFERTAKQRPTKIIQMPIMPKGYHLTTPLEILIPLIEESLKES